MEIKTRYGPGDVFQRRVGYIYRDYEVIFVRTESRQDRTEIIYGCRCQGKFVKIEEDDID